MGKMTIEQIEYILENMKVCQKQNPKAVIKFDLNSGSILIEFPLPKDYHNILKFTT